MIPPDEVVLRIYRSIHRDIPKAYVLAGVIFLHSLLAAFFLGMIFDRVCGANQNYFLVG
jgi:hypothetical protein